MSRTTPPSDPTEAGQPPAGASSVTAGAAQHEPATTAPGQSAAPNPQAVPPVGPAAGGSSPASGLANIGRTLAALRRLWPKLAYWALPIAALLYIVLVIRPWQSPAAATAQDVAAAWSDSIRKLGIEPLFPPQEDFNVGDIWAVIAAYDESPGQTREVGPRESIIGKGVRIGRIALDRLGHEGSRRPLFPNTKTENNSVVYDETSQAERTASANGGVELSFVSFPGLSITNRNADAGAVSLLLGLKASRGSSQTETVKIPIALTYSVPASKATVALDDWCTAEANRGMCDDETIRAIIAYSLQNKVYDQLDGKYRYRFEIKLVTQAFLTRQIEYQSASRTIMNRGIGKAEAPAVPGAGEDTTPTDEGATIPEASGETGVGIDNNSRVAVDIDKVIYPRPVVFGFRSVSTALTPSEPKK